MVISASAAKHGRKYADGIAATPAGSGAPACTRAPARMLVSHALTYNHANLAKAGAAVRGSEVGEQSHAVRLIGVGCGGRFAASRRPRSLFRQSAAARSLWTRMRGTV